MRWCEPQQRYDSITIDASESACLYLRKRYAAIAFDFRHDGDRIARRKNTAEPRSDESIASADVGL